MKQLLIILSISLFLTSCITTSKTDNVKRPQVVHYVNDSTFIIKGNARHFQQRKDYKMKQKQLSKN